MLHPVADRSMWTTESWKVRLPIVYSFQSVVADWRLRRPGKLDTTDEQLHEELFMSAQ